MKAQFIGVGVGPGDPELITLKAAKYIQQADVISYIANKAGVSQARQIASDVIAHNPLDSKLQEIPIMMPMYEDRREANTVYDAASQRILEVIKTGKQVIFLCEGDPLFFGSFAYLLDRLQEQVTCQVVPGISSVNAASAALQLPLTILQESFAVVSGRHSQVKIEAALYQHDSVVIMKAGKSRPRILDALDKTGRTQDAQYLEYISRESEKVVTDIRAIEHQPGPYFSLFVVTKQRNNHR